MQQRENVYILGTVWAYVTSLLIELAGKMVMETCLIFGISGLERYWSMLYSLNAKYRMCPVRSDHLRGDIDLF